MTQRMTDENDGRIAGAVRAARRAAGMTQQQLADAAGCGRATVYRDESGNRPVEAGRLHTYGVVLGVRFVMGADAPAGGLEPPTYRLPAVAA